MCGKETRETTDNRGMSLIPGGLAGGRKWFLRNPPSLYGMKHRSGLSTGSTGSADSGGRFVCFASTQALIVDKVAFSPTISRLVFGPVPPNGGKIDKSHTRQPGTTCRVPPRPAGAGGSQRSQKDASVDP
ncbi:hypothetical protein GE21DRAFT_1287712 [Neurospora crassa]|nr:hypothetical protein GE21DRAFT_1287712 [Neurospora crassa]